MATTPVHAHHMLGKIDVHIWTSVSRWWHFGVCWVGGWVGRVDGDDGKVKKHVHRCRVQQRVLLGWE